MQLRKVEATSVAQAADAIGSDVVGKYSMPAGVPHLEAQNELMSCRPFLQVLLAPAHQPDARHTAHAECALVSQPPLQKSKKAKGGMGLPRLGLPSWASFATPAPPQHQGMRLYREADTSISTLLPRSASVLASIF